MPYEGQELDKHTAMKWYESYDSEDEEKKDEANGQKGGKQA